MKPTVPEVLPLVRAVYRRHSAGCCLHVVLDDGNAEQHFAESCLAGVDAEHEDCRQLAAALVLMSFTQRAKLSSLVGRRAPWEAA